MKKLMSAVLGISLFVPLAVFAQDTGGDKAATAGKKASKTVEKEHKVVEKGHKGGKKGKKGMKGTASPSTTPPPK